MLVEFSPRMITCQCLLHLLWYDFQNVWRVSWRSHWVTSPALAPGVVCWEPRFSHKELRTSGSPHHAEPCGDNSLLSAGEHKIRGVLKGAGGCHRGPRGSLVTTAVNNPALFPKDAVDFVLINTARLQSAKALHHGLHEVKGNVPLSDHIRHPQATWERNSFHARWQLSDQDPFSS